MSSRPPPAPFGRSPGPASRWARQFVLSFAASAPRLVYRPRMAEEIPARIRLLLLPVLAALLAVRPAPPPPSARPGDGREPERGTCHSGARLDLDLDHVTTAAAQAGPRLTVGAGCPP